MKRLIIVLLTVLMSISLIGCGKKPNGPKPNDKNDTPVVTPTEKPQSNKAFVSKLGTNYDLEDALVKFNEEFDKWNAFIMYENNDGSIEYGVWDDVDIYRRNFESYARDGIMPVIYTVANFEDGKGEVPIRYIVAFLPYENIEELPEGYEEQVVYFQKLLIKAILPELSDSNVDKLIDKLSLTDKDGFDAYRHHQADVSEFEKTTVEVYTSETAEKPLELAVEYEDDNKTLILSLVQE